MHTQEFEAKFDLEATVLDKGIDFRMHTQEFDIDLLIIIKLIINGSKNNNYC